MNCKVMGIVNVTPDSFSDGGQFFKPAEAIRRARNLIAEGADVIDIGAESTRPGAEPIGWEEEWSRLEPVLAGLAGGHETRDARRERETRDARRERETRDARLSPCERCERVRALGLSPHVLSIDTYHPETAELALKAGARMINCVKTEPAREMAALCAQYGAELVIPAAALGAVEGRETGDERREPATPDAQPATPDARPATPDAQPSAPDPQLSTLNPQPSLWLDPMIGFGTSRSEDLALLKSIPELAKKGRVLVGVSRKRIVRRLSGEHGVGKLLGGSLALAVWCAAHGASMVRVHDVKETVEALAAWAALED